MALTDWQQRARHGEQVLAVVDQAADPEIKSWLLAQAADQEDLNLESLFAESAVNDCIALSPWIIQLDADSTGWALLDHPLIAAHSSLWAGAETQLLAQLRHRLSIFRDEDTPIFLRYYTPHNLHLISHYFAPERLAAFMGPIQAWGYASETGWEQVEQDINYSSSDPAFSLTRQEQAIFFPSSSMKQGE